MIGDDNFETDPIHPAAFSGFLPITFENGRRTPMWLQHGIETCSINTVEPHWNMLNHQRGYLSANSCSQYVLISRGCWLIGINRCATRAKPVQAYNFSDTDLFLKVLKKQHYSGKFSLCRCGVWEVSNLIFSYLVYILPCGSCRWGHCFTPFHTHVVHSTVTPCSL